MRTLLLVEDSTEQTVETAAEAGGRLKQAVNAAAMPGDMLLQTSGMVWETCEWYLLRTRLRVRIRGGIVAEARGARLLLPVVFLHSFAVQTN